MQDLPPGWRVTNSSGSHSGPSPIPDDQDNASNDSDEGEDSDPDIRPDSPGWEDVDPSADIEEGLDIKCLICVTTFSTASEMLHHCVEIHALNFERTVREFELDFYSTIKLVNYIRSNTGDGGVPDLQDPAAWADEKYLQPVMENDALLFSLDEIIDFEKMAETEAQQDEGQQAVNGHG